VAYASSRSAWVLMLRVVLGRIADAVGAVSCWKGLTMAESVRCGG
jgi:hypothetical protein